MSLYLADIQCSRTVDPLTARALENDVCAKVLDPVADDDTAIEDLHDELHLE